jgi:hypothetical protein
MNFIFSNLLLFANRTGLRGAPNPLCHNHITDPIYFFFQDYKLKYKLPSALAFVPKNKKDEIISILKTPHDQIAKKFFQNNVLFESDNKETHNIHEDVRQGIDINIFNDFTKFVASHNILCLKNDNHNMTFSSQSSQSIENKKASFLFKPNLVAVVERIIFNALCCFIPTKRLRCFVRNKGAIKLNRFIGKIVASFFIKKTTRKKIRCYFEDLVDAQ